MSAKVDQFCDRLRDRLNAIEAWLESVKADIRSLPWKVRKTLQSKLKEARTKLQAQKERVEQTRAELKSPPQLAAELLVESVIGWKAKPDVREPHPGPERGRGACRGHHRPRRGRHRRGQGCHALRGGGPAPRCGEVGRFGKTRSRVAGPERLALRTPPETSRTGAGSLP